MNNQKGKRSMKILLATDGSAYSKAAVEEIARRPFPVNTKVRIVTAYESSPAITSVGPMGVTQEYYAEADRLALKMAENILELRNVNIYQGNSLVLEDVNIAVSKGEFVSIVGKSGCGKSTLLYLISTLDTDYTGEIFINGKKVTGQTQNELAHFRNEHIGFVFQFHFLQVKYDLSHLLKRRNF